MDPIGERNMQMVEENLPPPTLPSNADATPTGGVII
jgi:hypothetical protein